MEIFTKKCFLAGAGLLVAASHFWLSQRRNHLPFTHARVYWNPTILHPTGSQRPSIQAWVADREKSTQNTPPVHQGKGYCGKRFQGSPVYSCLSLCDLLGFCSVALIVIFYVFSRAEVKAITCAQQTCVRALKVSGEARSFLIQENGKLETSISCVCIWESE